LCGAIHERSAKGKGSRSAPGDDSDGPRSLAQRETPKVFDALIEAFVKEAVRNRFSAGRVKAKRRTVAHFAMGAYLPAVQTLMS
jgi:hypothetical protein